MENPTLTPAPPSTFAIMSSTIKKDFIPTDDEIASINSFMMCRWLSNHPMGVEVANFINNNTDLPINVQYWFVRSAMNGIKYIAYPKGIDKKDEVLEIISKHYDCNFEIAKEYLRLLPPSEKDRIIAIYKNVGKIK